jgi:polyhydroxyalkanoate synthesis regulator phasin
MAAAKKGTKAKSSKPKNRSTRGSTSGNKSVEEFREALEKSVTISRDRIQEVMDDAVKRGRMTRADANKTVSSLVTKSRQQTDELLAELEKLLDQARRGVESRVAPARKRAEKAASAATKRIRTTADPVVAEADKLRRRAGVGGGAPISGYEDLNATQVKSRLKDMNKADLRKVRTQEKRGKARKGILDDIEKRLNA